MFDKLEDVERRFVELEDTLAHGTLAPKDLTEITKERANIEDIVESYREYKDLKRQREEADAMLRDGDAEIRSLAKEELPRVDGELAAVEKKLLVLMLPTDRNDAKNVILEVRAGTGGEEAALFAGDLLRMYRRYAENRGWRTELMSSTPASAGGIKEAIILIEGKAVYSRLKFESGVHRVQRVPSTEAQGRIHTSACTVAVLPEADDIDVDIKPSDLEISTFRSSGAGGQHVNTTDSAVRIVHKPTGVVVECQDERSQHKNREKALKVLSARIYEKKMSDQQAEIAADRRSQVGSGDRSERIRTYNFPQARVTDHRINLTLYRLSEIVDGALDDVLDALGANHQAELLKKNQGSA